MYVEYKDLLIPACREVFGKQEPYVSKPNMYSTNLMKIHIFCMYSTQLIWVQKGLMKRIINVLGEAGMALNRDLKSGKPSNFTRSTRSNVTLKSTLGSSSPTITTASQFYCENKDFLVESVLSINKHLLNIACKDLLHSLKDASQESTDLSFVQCKRPMVKSS